MHPLFHLCHKIKHFQTDVQPYVRALQRYSFDFFKTTSNISLNHTSHFFYSRITVFRNEPHKFYTNIKSHNIPTNMYRLTERMTRENLNVPHPYYKTLVFQNIYNTILKYHKLSKIIIFP